MSDTPNLVPVPGGHARLRDPSDLTTRHTRAYQTILTAFGVEKFGHLVASQAVKEAQEAGVSSEDAFLAAVAELGLDFREADLLGRMTDATIYKWVQDIRVPGVRVPADVDDVQSLPEGVYRALAEATGKREAEHAATQQENGFGVAAFGNELSPTGASSA